MQSQLSTTQTSMTQLTASQAALADANLASVTQRLARTQTLAQTDLQGLINLQRLANQTAALLAPTNSRIDQFKTSINSTREDALRETTTSHRWSLFRSDVHDFGSRGADASGNASPSFSDATSGSGRDRPGYPLRHDARGCASRAASFSWQTIVTAERTPRRAG